VNKKKNIKIMIVDDHEIVRHGLRQSIEQVKDFSVIAEADTRAEMTIMMLEDLILLAAAGNADDISKVHMIPEQKTLLKEGESAGIRLFSQDIS